MTIRAPGWIDAALTGVVFYVLATLIVVTGMALGTSVVQPAADIVTGRNLAGRFGNWDAQWYREIAEEGYSLKPGTQSTLTFFPAYPLTGRIVARATGLRTDLALVVVAHVCLLLAFIVMAAMVRRRGSNPPRIETPPAPPSEGGENPTSRLSSSPLKGGRENGSPELTDYSLLAMGLLPTTVFFRMAYSEAMFVLVLAVLLYGMQRRWPAWTLAIVAGLLTAVRATGIAAAPVLMVYAWRQFGRAGDETSPTSAEDGERKKGGRTLQRAAYAGAVAAVSVWGLAAYMTYQAIQFGDPLAFVKVQSQWRLRLGDDPPLSEKVTALATLEPAWGVYVPGKSGYWARRDLHGNALFSLQFANPIYFAAAIVLLVIGWRARRITGYEAAIGGLLLLIPYVTKAYDNEMAGFGRFAAVVLPVYPVAGWLLSKLGGPLSAAVLSLAAFFLGAYAALFAAGYWII
ncbi:MAG: hypothetical protein HY000_12020 [Planctomycetes bacterium]|nr:hypothetical protein [Planctomycetota bacterium]